MCHLKKQRRFATEIRRLSDSGGRENEWYDVTVLVLITVQCCVKGGGLHKIFTQCDV